MNKKFKKVKYTRKKRRGTLYVAKKFDIVHSCGGCIHEQDDVCTMHENIPAFENKKDGISTKYFGICLDWEDKVNFDDIIGEIMEGCEKYYE